MNMYNSVELAFPSTTGLILSTQRLLSLTLPIQGETPLQNARSEGHAAIVELLLKAGATA
jgi:hypothetical protein